LRQFVAGFVVGVFGALVEGVDDGGEATVGVVGVICGDACLIGFADDPAQCVVSFKCEGGVSIGGADTAVEAVVGVADGVAVGVGLADEVAVGVVAEGGFIPLCIPGLGAASGGST